MEEYIFILGKNPQLSFKEIQSYLNARKIKFQLKKFVEAEVPYVILETEIKPREVIEELGGTVKIGKVLAEIPNKIAYEPFKSGSKKELENLQEILGREFLERLLKIKSEFKAIGISIYLKSKKELKNLDPEEIADFYGHSLTKSLRKEGLKYLSVLKPSSLRYSESSYIIPSEALRKKMDRENLELLLCVDEEQTYIAITEAIYNVPNEKKKGDRLLRPPKWKYGMRPRLAKIFVNLSEAKPKDKLLDPFCGIGTILQEAVLNDINVVGSDINEDAIEFTKKNMRNLKKEKPTVLTDVHVDDVRKLSLKDGSVDAVATEPILGPSLTKKPKVDYARKLINELTPFYEEALSEIFRVLKNNSKACICFPNIASSHKSQSIDVKNLSKKAGFKNCKKIGTEYESFQVVMRDVYVLEK